VQLPAEETTALRPLALIGGLMLAMVAALGELPVA